MYERDKKLSLLLLLVSIIDSWPEMLRNPKNVRKIFLAMLQKRRHDTQQNDTHHNDNQQIDIQHDATQHNGIQNNDSQHNNTQHNDTWRNNIHHNDT